MNPVNTVFDAKRLIGRKSNDPSVQADMKHWPFRVISGTAQKPMIQGVSCYRFPRSAFSLMLSCVLRSAELR